MRVNADNDATGRGRLEIRADDPSLTPYAGLAIVGELARRTRLVELIDAELGVVRTERAVKRRRRGLSAGALMRDRLPPISSLVKARPRCAHVTT